MWIATPTRHTQQSNHAIDLVAFKWLVEYSHHHHQCRHNITSSSQSRQQNIKLVSINYIDDTRRNRCQLFCPSAAFGITILWDRLVGTRWFCSNVICWCRLGVASVCGVHASAAQLNTQHKNTNESKYVEQYVGDLWQYCDIDWLTNPVWGAQAQEHNRNSSVVNSCRVIERAYFALGGHVTSANDSDILSTVIWYRWLLWHSAVLISSHDYDYDYIMQSIILHSFHSTDCCPWCSKVTLFSPYQHRLCFVAHPIYLLQIGNVFGPFYFFVWPPLSSIQRALPPSSLQPE